MCLLFSQQALFICIGIPLASLRFTEMCRKTFACQRGHNRTRLYGVYICMYLMVWCGAWGTFGNCNIGHYLFTHWSPGSLCHHSGLAFHRHFRRVSEWLLFSAVTHDEMKWIFRAYRHRRCLKIYIFPARNWIALQSLVNLRAPHVHSHPRTLAHLFAGWVFPGCPRFSCFPLKLMLQPRTWQVRLPLLLWHFSLAYFAAQFDACNCNLFTLKPGTWRMLNSFCLHSLWNHLQGVFLRYRYIFAKGRR